MIARLIITVAVVVALPVLEASAQASRPTRRPTSPSQNTRSQAGRASLQRGSRGTVQQPRSSAGQARPTTRPVAQQVQKLSPQMERILRDWSASSDRIQRLHGTHTRRVYDTLFKVEKKSKGKFYHERPDKGRIDIEAPFVKQGTLSAKKDKKTGKPFKVVADQPEKWICDGKRIIDMNETEKAASIFSIPPQAQGESIMNGPLPFLLGMPAEIAKKRYWLKLISDQVNQRNGLREVRILAKPRWQNDRANWKEAQVILNKANYLPLHVKLVDSAGTTETVFSFPPQDMKAFSKKQNVVVKIFPGQDPFKPNLRAYKIHSQVPGTPEKPAIQLKPGQKVIPDVRGYIASKAKARLEHAGFKVHKSWSRGGPAPQKNLELTVRGSNPAPMTPVKAGSVIKLTVYERIGTVKRTAGKR